MGESGPGYALSDCSGTRKALLVGDLGRRQLTRSQIGINYIGSSNALRGCINDVHNVSTFLKGESVKGACSLAHSR